VRQRSPRFLYFLCADDSSLVEQAFYAKYWDKFEDSDESTLENTRIHKEYEEESEAALVAVAGEAVITRVCEVRATCSRSSRGPDPPQFIPLPPSPPALPSLPPREGCCESSKRDSTRRGGPNRSGAGRCCCVSHRVVNPLTAMSFPCSVSELRCTLIRAWRSI
jgi:hypothetical protein